jgi:hypothetical protein
MVSAVIVKQLVPFTEELIMYACTLLGIFEVEEWMVARKQVTASVSASGVWCGVKGDFVLYVGAVGVAGEQYHMEGLWQGREQDY